jgi:hypothetical protein
LQLNTGRKKLAGKGSAGAAEGVTLSGKPTAGGRHSGESAVFGGAEGAMAHARAAKSLRQKDGKAVNVSRNGFSIPRFSWPVLK